MSTRDLDFGNVLKMVYDPPTESLKVLATISIGSISVELDAATDSVRLGDGTVLSTFTTIGSQNALDVNIAGGTLALDISHVDDSIRLGDGTNLVTTTVVGPKTGLDVSLLDGNVTIDGGTINTVPYVIENIFNEVSAVPIASSTNILSYTALVDKYIFFIGVSGENIGTFDIQIDAVTIDKIRTTYTKFEGVTNLGNGVILLSAGQTITVDVENNGSTSATFEAKIQVRNP